jgi:hypothetical protein
MKNFFKTYLLIAYLCSSVISNAQNKKEVRKPFTNPTVPATLIIENYTGNITVEGYKGKEVIVETKNATPEAQNEEKDENLPFLIEERHNTMLIRANASNHQTLDLHIKVPEKTTLKVKIFEKGNVAASRTSRLVEVDNQNGSVNLNEMQGWAVINTVNGDVKADFTEVIANKTMSFIALNGDVYLDLPKDLEANFKMKSNTGQILNEFQKPVPQIQNFVEDQTNEQASRAYNKQENMELDIAAEKEKNEIAKKSAAEDKITEKKSLKKDIKKSVPTYNAPATYESKANGGGAIVFISSRDGKIQVRKKRK